MTGINYLGVFSHPVTMHDVLTLFFHRAGVRTVFPFAAPEQWHQTGRLEMLFVRVTMGESKDDFGAEILVRRWRWQLDG